MNERNLPACLQDSLLCVIAPVMKEVFELLATFQEANYYQKKPNCLMWDKTTTTITITTITNIFKSNYLNQSLCCWQQHICISFEIFFHCTFGWNKTKNKLKNNEHFCLSLHIVSSFLSKKIKVAKKRKKETKPNEMKRNQMKWN